MEECKEEVSRIDDMMKFIDEHKDDVKAAFCVFDKRGTGKIPTGKLGKYSYSFFIFALS